MKNKATPLVDEYLQTVQGMQQAETDDFFYTRLKARMNKHIPHEKWGLPFKPALMIGTLTALLFFNGFLLSRQSAHLKNNMIEKSPLQKFAESYDLVTSSSF